MIAALAGLSLIGGIGLAAPASAVSDELVSTAEAARLTAKWDQYGVSDAVQAKLLDKLNSGRLTDDMGSSEPTNVRTIETAGTIEEVRTYGDGSISVVQVSKSAVAKPGGISTMGVSKCSTRTTGGYRYLDNCVASGWFTSVTITFSVSVRVPYSQGTGEGYARIMSYANATYSCGALVTCSNGQWVDFTQQQDATNRAKIVRTVDWQGTTIAGGSGVTRLQFVANRGSLSTN